MITHMGYDPYIMSIEEFLFYIHLLENITVESLLETYLLWEIIEKHVDL